MEEVNDESPLEHEISLLKAMYPDEVQFDAKIQELTYTSPSQATLKLRVSSSPSGANAIPDIIFVTGPLPHKIDLRNQYRRLLTEANLEASEPILDSLIDIFNDLVGSNSSTDLEQHDDFDNTSNQKAAKFSTVIIWLHHLLAASKRKQALSPPSSAHGPVSGLSKPGYPGIMIFSGPSAEVNEHVQALKSLNWQAFQVRHEDDRLWKFKHGEGMKEVETMGEVVEEIDEGKKLDFMKAMGMK